MARIGLKNRIRKLENRRKVKSPNRVLHCRAQDVAAYADNMAALPVWQVGCCLPGGNPASGPLQAFPGRFALVPDFGSMADWEAAAARQQAELIAHARHRTNEPATEAPDIVGTFGDVEAPKRKGAKGARFVELTDGRTFDRTTGEFVE